MIILLKKRKNQTIAKDQTLTKMSLSALRMIWESEGSEDVIDENENQQVVFPRLKQKEYREKLRSYYDAGISAAEVIRKDIHGLIPKNHYKLFNEKKRPI